MFDRIFHRANVVRAAAALAATLSTAAVAAGPAGASIGADGLPGRAVGGVATCIDQPGGRSLLVASNPLVSGATNGLETVYFRPVVTRAVNGQWEYTYGAWHSTTVSNARTGYASFPQGGSDIVVWKFMTYWFGDEYYWPSIDKYGFDWAGQFYCG